MKNKFTFLLTTVLMQLSFFLSIQAAPVDTLTAKKVASKFMSKHLVLNNQARSSQPELSYTVKSNTLARGRTTDCFYVFNLDNGFVIISADDRLDPVVGYSTEGRFNPENIPSNMEAFLEDYKKEAEFVFRNNIRIQEVKNEWQKLIVGTLDNNPQRASIMVQPLIATRWAQGPPYNDKCPSQNGVKAVTGCVATAMGQIIRYWQHPHHGIGTYSYYLPEYGDISADFGNTVYDFDNMPNSINPSSPQAQIDAVSTLLYHCGVSVEMGYSPNGSGAPAAWMPHALQTYFGYPQSYHLSKDNYDNATWTAMLKEELDNLRPVLYGGKNSQSGHVFIVDGYDDADFFHINWGWGGNHNAYFKLSSLVPYDGHLGYTSNQSGVFGLNGGTSTIRCSPDELTFLTEAEQMSDVKKVNVLATNITENINISSSSGFEISLDSINFSSSVSLPSYGGFFFIRFIPTLTNEFEHGYCALSSGETHDTVNLRGYASLACKAPENFTITAPNTHDITLQWTTPTVSDDGPITFSWCDDWTFPFGTHNGTNYFMHRMALQDLVDFQGKQLTAVSFIPISQATYKIVVLKGGSYENGNYIPGTVVCEQLVTQSLDLENVNTVMLENPVPVETDKELWYGVSITGTGYDYPNNDAIPVVPGKSNVWGRMQGGNISFSDLYFDDSSNPLIATFTTIPINVENFTVYRDNVQLATTSNNSYNDYLQNVGDYVYTVTANWSNGCSAPVKKSFSNKAGIYSSPKTLEWFTNFGFNDLHEDSVQVTTVALANNVAASVTGPFTISSDNINYYTSTTIPTLGGKLYAKYNPISDSVQNDYGYVYLSSGVYKDTINLIGHCFTSPCSPPKNLLLSQQENDINLSWQKPNNEKTTKNISWDSVFVFYTSLNSDYEYEIINRYDTSDLQNLHNKKLTKISFYVIPGSKVSKIFVYEGGEFKTIVHQNWVEEVFEPGVKTIDQTVVTPTDIELTGWQTIELNQPITIDANKELWFGYSLLPVNGKIDLPLGNMNLQWGKGNLSGKQNANGDIEYWPTYSKNFPLKATIEDNTPTLVNYEVEKNSEFLANTLQTSYVDNISQHGTHKYSVTAKYDNGCEASVSGTITTVGGDPAPSVYATADSTICKELLPFTWNGHLFNGQESFVTTLQAHNGADSILTMNLTVFETQHESESVNACGFYAWKGQFYHNSGIYTFTTTDNNGCLKTDTLHLTINVGTFNSEEITACESYDWNGETYTTSGTYVHNYTNANGCASADTLHLTINNGTFNSEEVTACESYDWNGETYTTSGTYVHNYTNANGCASADTLHLTINYSDTTEITITTHDSCHVWNTETYCVSGVYTQVFENINNCDSVVILNLTVNTNITTHKNFSYDVYPNPFAEYTYFRITNSDFLNDDLTILIFDSRGKLLKQYSVLSNVTQLDMSQYASGMYLIKVINKQNIIAIEKIIKN